jgi:predicted enzyme related to lactoylglutathione lyase
MLGLLAVAGAVLCVVFFFIGRYSAGATSLVGPAADVCLLPGADHNAKSYCAFKEADNLVGDHRSSVSGIPYAKTPYVHLKSPRDFSRIEWHSVTVDDLHLAHHFYEHILGGVEVDFCSDLPKDLHKKYCHNDEHGGHGVLWWGEDHWKALFGINIHHQDGVQIPDIKNGSQYKGLSRFFVFGNGIVELRKFHSMNESFCAINNEPFCAFNRRDPQERTSPCITGAGHIDWWIEDDLDMNDFIAEAEKQAGEQGKHHMSNVAFNRPVPQKTRADRANVPKEQFANKVPTDLTGGAFGGLEWAYFKGPIAEQMELYKIVGSMKEGIGRAYCDRGAVSPAFVDRPKKTRKMTSQMHGIFQFGYRTLNLHRAVGFYTEVMGGSLITYPTHGINIHDDSAHWMILANETITGFENYAKDKPALSRDEYLRSEGVANISSSGGDRLDHRFILFDNMVVEPLQYTRGLTFGGKVFERQYASEVGTNPAMIGGVSAAFGGSGDKPLADRLTDLSVLVEQRGFADPTAPWIPHPAHIARFGNDHPFHGLEYAYGRGESHESIAFVNVGPGRFRDALHKAFDKAGHVSTMLDQHNVFKEGKMKKFCDSVLKSE